MMPRPVRLEPVVSWKEYVDGRFSEWDKRNDQVRAVLVDANNKEKAALEMRLDGLNHLQRRIDALVGTLASQPELRLAIERVVTEAQSESRRIFAEIQAAERRQEVAIATLDDRIKKLERFQSWLLGAVAFASALAVVLPIIFHFLPK